MPQPCDMLSADVSALLSRPSLLASCRASEASAEGVNLGCNPGSLTSCSCTHGAVVSMGFRWPAALQQVAVAVAVP